MRVHLDPPTITPSIITALISVVVVVVVVAVVLAVLTFMLCQDKRISQGMRLYEMQVW